MKVLLIDDDASITEVIDEFLTLSGHDTVVFNKPLEAADWIVDHASEIDIAFIDIKMPNMNGFDLLVLVKNENENIPVVAISGYFSEEDIEGPRKFGFDRILSKPIPLATIKECIDTLANPETETR